MKPRGIETRSLRHGALLVVALALILGRACPGMAAGNVSLAVMDFQVNGFSDYLGGAVAEMLRTGFVGLPGIDILERAQPDAVIYLAGADPYAGDRLGRLSLSLPGLAARDTMVFNACRSCVT